MNHATKSTKGFTLIELMLAMTFISVLLMAIAMTIIQIGNLYNRGMTLKEITQTGRDIAEDVEGTMSNSGSFSLTTDYVSVPVGSANPSGGRLCTGTYSYIWNYGKVHRTDVTAPGITRYDAGSSKRNDWVNLVKVADTARAYCIRVGPTLQHPNITLAHSNSNATQELLNGGDHDIALHKFAMVSNDTTLRDGITKQQIYLLDFTVGTNKFIIDGSGWHSTLNADQTACLMPGSAYSDLNYCSVETFSLVLRAGNRFK